MPQRVIIIWSCSLCQAETDKQSEMTPAELIIRGQTLTYDICEACEKDETGLGAFVEAGFRERGKAKKPKAVPAAVPAAVAVQEPLIVETDEGPMLYCPECQDAFPTAPGLAQHRSRKHGVLAKTAAEAAQRGTGPHKCPECKAQGVDYGALKPQGLGIHRRNAHGVAGLAGEAKKERSKYMAAKRKKAFG